MLNNLTGSFGDYQLFSYDGNIDFTIINRGWISNVFKYELYYNNIVHFKKIILIYKNS